MKQKNDLLRYTRTCVFVFFVVTAPAKTTAAAPDIPIMAGGRPGPACDGRGEVTGLDPHGDNFLSVQSGPGGRPYFEKDRVFTGQALFICERRGRWLGVVYAPNGGDCGVSAPLETRGPYSGLCHSGWVYSGYVRLVASTGQFNERSEGSDGANCSGLWASRNQIFKDAGFCFKTPDTIARFGNAG